MIDIYNMSDVINAINDALRKGDKAEVFIAKDKITGADSVKVITVNRRLMASQRIK